jgi:hypothetical protein
MKYNKETDNETPEFYDIAGVRKEEFIDKQKLMQDINKLIDEVWKPEYRQRMKELTNKKYNTLSPKEFKSWSELL